MNTKTKKVAFSGVCLAFCMVLGYIEHLLPLPVSIYGIKLGLANLGTLVILQLVGKKSAFLINLARILLCFLLFGNAFSLCYSLAGGVCSSLAMIFLSHSKRLSLIGLSVIGATVHNVAQIAVAAILLGTGKIIFYLPVLLVSGVVCGITVGVLAKIITSNSYLKNLCNKGENNDLQ